MKATAERMEAHLRHWHLKIDDLAARAGASGVPASFDSLTYVDELKALHAVARAKLDAFKAAGDAERAQLEDGLIRARSELAAAFKNPGHRRRR